MRSTASTTDSLLCLQTAEEKKVKKAKDVQAKANLAVKKQEAVVKASEKALDDKVSDWQQNSRLRCKRLNAAFTETWAAHFGDPD